MKHEDFRLRYNEIMFDERDLIIKFLREQADLRYGNQMFEWSLSLKVFEADGDPFEVREIALVNDEVLQIRGISVYGHRVNLNAEDLCLGELSKILDALPDAESVVYSNAIDDMGIIRQDYNIGALLKESPFKFSSNESTFTVLDVFKDKAGKICFEIEEELHGEKGSGIWEELDTEVARDLSEHIKVSVLRCSDEYKRLKKTLNQFGGNLYNFAENGNAGSIYLTPKGTDLQLIVLDVSMEHGPLEVLVSIAETRLVDSFGEDCLLLQEKDLTPENVGVIANFFEAPVNEKVQLSDEQKVLVKKFKDVCEELMKANVGIVRDDNDDSLLFLNMEHIGELDAEAVNIPEKTGFYDITDYLEERQPCIEKMHFYSQEHERILATFV